MPWGAVVALVGAGAGAYSSNKASKAQQQSSSDALNLQRDQFNTVRQDTAAQREIGTNAINKLADILGIERSGPTAPTQDQFTKIVGSSNKGKKGPLGNLDPLGSKLVQQGALPDKAGLLYKNENGNVYGFDQSGFDAATAKYNQDKAAFDSRARGMDAFTADPGYQFRLDNTNKTLDRYQSANRLTGGRAVKEAERYGQDFASNEFGNSVGRLFTLAGFGPVANNTSANAGANMANQSGQYMLSSGNAGANGYANMNNAIQGGLNNYATYKSYQNWNNQLKPTMTSGSDPYKSDQFWNNYGNNYG